MITIQRITKITLGDQVITIMEEDEPKLIDALSKLREPKKQYRPINEAGCILREIK